MISKTVAGREVHIHYANNRSKYNQFKTWLESTGGESVAVDTETTGLNMFAPNFRIRLLQIGRGTEAWVLPLETLNLPAEEIENLLTGRPLVFHNASFDLNALLSQGIVIPWDNVTDTKILASLVDPRSKKEGGSGHSLQELTAAYIDPVIAEDVKGSVTRLSRELGIKKAEYFTTVPIDDENFILYAGMDVILTHLLHNCLMAAIRTMKQNIPQFNTDLIWFEHQVARICAEMEYTGFLLDVDYSQRLSKQLTGEQEAWEAVAYAEHGVESVNAAADVAEALLEEGVTLTSKTDTGKWKIDKSVLEPLTEQGNTLAIAVTEAKRANKWRNSWVDKFLEQADPMGRCHASINPLAARTGRMSITGIPAQTLPSSGWSIRRCFIADPGYSIVSCDYAAQELRVLAALSGDTNMVNAFKHDEDLHQKTADASGVPRKVGKTVNFAYVYGSGAGNIARTCGISVQKARQVIKGFEKTYPRVKQLSEKLQASATKNGYIVSANGRVLPVDRDKPYAALNYLIQSTSRDITASALIRMDKAGYTPMLRLPIHDEVIACVPEKDAQEWANKLASYMECEFKGLTIASDHEVYGASWGGGYVPDEERDEYEATFK